MKVEADRARAAMVADWRVRAEAIAEERWAQSIKPPQPESDAPARALRGDSLQAQRWLRLSLAGNVFLLMVLLDQHFGLTAVVADRLAGF